MLGDSRHRNAPVLYDSSGNVLIRYYQWDVNQFITIKGIEAGCTMECHFAQVRGGVAYVVNPTASGEDFVVNVPNMLFQTPKNFYLFLYVDTPNNGQRTKYEYEIPVLYRPKPEAYEEPSEQERMTMRMMMLKAEGWATGQHNGVDVDSTDEAYHNNAKYYLGEAGTIIDEVSAARDAAEAAQAAAEEARDAVSAIAGFDVMTTSDVNSIINGYGDDDG